MWTREQRREYDKAWYAKLDDKEKKRKYQLTKDRKKSIRSVVQEYLQSHPCIDCGEKDIIVLEFDHVGTDKIMDISTMMKRGWAIPSIMSEINKCEVCCANCHRRRTHRRRISGLSSASRARASEA